MTGHLRASDTDPRSDVGIGRADRPDQETEDLASHGMSWDGAHPDVEASTGLDAEIAAAAKSLFFAPDLLRPGPGLLPFGAKARDRRERRREVDAIAATRRTELGELLAARRDSRVDQGVRATRRGRPQVVAAVLTALVIAVAAAGWLMSLTTTTAPTQNQADTGSAATDLPTYESDPITPPDSASTSAAVVDLSSPEAAAVSWMAAWCPIDPHQHPDALAADLRAVMTTAGWAQFTATLGQPLAAPGVTASCSTPAARAVSRPPGSDTTVVVLVSATRIITSDSAGATEPFRIERRQYVVRGDDGVWRVDVPAVGG